MSHPKFEILIEPLKIYWIGMPLEVAKKIRIELLKRDVLLISCGYEKFLSASENANLSDSIILFNFDSIVLFYENTGRDLPIAIHHIIKLIKSKYSENSIVHTTIINPVINDAMKENSILFIEKNITIENSAIPFLVNIASNFFKKQNRIARAFIRLQFYPEEKIPVYISEIANEKVNIKALLKDVSLNGIGLIVKELKDGIELPLKEFCTISFEIDHSIIRISKALITRVNYSAKELGCSFSINNPNLISKSDSSILVDLIHSTLNGIIDEYSTQCEMNFSQLNDNKQ